MTDILIQLRGVAERDVDLFLVEELVASPAFRAWFTSALDVGAGFELVAVERSALSSSGESDLDLVFASGASRTVVLVENKIDAIMQPRQAERYQERAQQRRAEPGTAVVITLLVAPERYATDSAGFDRRLTYEDIRAALVSNGTPDARTQYKLRLLDLAMDRARTGWVAVPSESTSAFWTRYFDLTKELAPQLRMPRPGAKPALSSFVVFKPTVLRKGVRLIHKLPYGRVDLQFDGRIAELDAFAERYRTTLSDGMYVAPASKSFAVRVEVPQVNLEGSVSEAEASMRAGILAAERLHVWYSQVAPHIGAT
ncbi:MAG: PD-(D/E)XK nuclease family protein [Gemmatimonadaceae bacterium]|nr:PD-(D/E)XK nuclease family protein [Gemmatimonadaceae bacterium]